MKIAVTGSTGFVGGYVVNELLRRGHGVRVVARRPDGAVSKFNRRVEAAPGDVLNLESLVAAFSGCDAVVHLVGIINEKGGHSFDEIHRQGTENAAVAAQKALARRYLQMSAMGSSPDAPSEYARTKAAGEDAVRRTKLDWTIFRPSIIFGPGDGFARLLAKLVDRNPGFIPVIGPGTVKFMPVSARDVARLFADALDKPESAGKSFEVGGPETFTMNEIYREIASAVGKPEKPMIHFPIWYGRIIATLMNVLPNPPLTNDQLNSLSRDNVGDTSPTTALFGPSARQFRPGIREYIHPRGRHDPTIGI
jgi:NADH dehydrogenase